MKTKHYILLALVGVITFLLGLFIGRNGMGGSSDIASEETRETKVDTIHHRAPRAHTELAIGTQCYNLPVYPIPAKKGDGTRQSCENNFYTTDSVTTAYYGTGAGGEPRCSKDSAIVELPIIQRHYADSTYEAWISGPVDPRLDSLRVFAGSSIITRREWKPPKRWHIGPTIGYGYTSKGFQPYIGISITYSIISF